MPFCPPVTPAPSADTVPHTSPPETCGSARCSAGSPRRIHTSMWFSAVAETLTCTSPGPGVGTGTSAISSTSGPPWVRNRAARI